MLQRLYPRTENLGVLFCFTNIEVLATKIPPLLLFSERHTHQPQQFSTFLIGFSGGNKCYFHTADAIDLIIFDLRENQLLFKAQGIVAAAVKALLETPLKSLTRGMEAEISLSTNSYILSPRRVTLQPMDMP